MFRKLTPLGLALFILACVAALVIGFTAVAKIAGENPLQVFQSTPDDSVAEVFFHESGIVKASIGGGATIRLATVVGSERAIAVSCPPGFDPEMTKTYIVESVSLETVDGRYTQPVWVLRPSERPKPPATTGELVIVK
jgi:hypothetical protein